MKPAPFAYHRPVSLDEVFDLLDRYDEDARLLAGGQSLVPILNMRLATPRAIIDINRLPGLDGIRLEGSELAIGALARHEAVEHSPLVRAHAPLVATAMPHIGHTAIRARGTLGGSLALADPAAELPACAVALGSTIRTARRHGGREIPAADFFRGVYTTVLQPGEMIVEVAVPALAPGWRSWFGELARRHGDYALAGLAAHARVADGTIAEARLVYFGVGTVPVRARGAEVVLTGRRPEPDVLGDAVRRLDEDLDPPDDVHGSPALRRRLAGVLLTRGALELVKG